MTTNVTDAPGAPGLDPYWTSSTKDAVGTACNPATRVWFTIGGGILNEIYYPRVDLAAVRDLGLIVTNGKDYFCEEKSGTDSQVEWMAPGVPAFRVTNRARDGRFTIIKEIFADPLHHVVLQRVELQVEQPDDYHLYVLLAPHLADTGENNTAEVGSYKNIPLLQAFKPGVALALGSSVPWLARSAGFVGHSDGWQDLYQHKRLTWFYQRAADGNVALTGELDLSRAVDGKLVLALGFGRETSEAGFRVRAALNEGFDRSLNLYMRQWQEWQAKLCPLTSDGNDFRYRASTAVLKCHLSKDFPGGIIASLSIPWGATRGDDDRGGYHLCWPRDQVESAGGLLAAGSHGHAIQCLRYLQTTQEADGHWPQNMWLDGSAYWDGLQLDETAAPILLTDLAERKGALNEAMLLELWPMVRQAAGYLVRRGPATGEDRWERTGGFTGYTMASATAALVIAAELANRFAEPQLAGFLHDTADVWNESIERRMYVANTPLAQKFGVAGYYVRTAAQAADVAEPLERQTVNVVSRSDRAQMPTVEQVSVDALALVRFGLRAADDPRIRDTTVVIDRLLKIETKNGPLWHRYNFDGYGEQADGSPYHGVGVGRAWPLLTGERAHFEIMAANFDRAHQLCQAMEFQATATGLFPEQIWDTADIPARGLYLGQPSSSARPLAWAHAEYLKLLRSLTDREVFDLPVAAYQRYVKRGTMARHAIWRPDLAIREFRCGRILRVEALMPAVVRWTVDDWASYQDSPLAASGLGHYFVELPTSELRVNDPVIFTLRWTEGGRWEGQNHTAVAVA